LQSEAYANIIILAVRKRILTREVRAVRNKAVSVFKALAHPLRLKVVDMLATGDKCVCELFPALGVSQPNASQHLTILKAADVVDSYRDGSRVYYKLTSGEFERLVRDCRRASGEPEPEPYEPLKNPCEAVV
jgi:ArsR family transcriptional regulator